MTDEITVQTNETDQRRELLHQSVRKYGAFPNMVPDTANGSGSIRQG